MTQNKQFYRPSEVLSRKTGTVPYVDTSWQTLYPSGVLEFDSKLVDMVISFDLSPTSPKHRIRMIPKGAVTEIEIYPYENSTGEDTANGDVVSIFPELLIPEGASFTLEVYATSAGGSTATLDYLELLEMR
jgi:hypothetical protein